MLEVDAMKHCSLRFLFLISILSICLIFSLSPLRAQVPIPLPSPTPSPTPTVPTLGEALDWLNEKLEFQGSFRYVTYEEKKDGKLKKSLETKVIKQELVDINDCNLKVMHIFGDDDGKWKKEILFPLKELDVSKVQISRQVQGPPSDWSYAVVVVVKDLRPLISTTFSGSVNGQRDWKVNGTDFLIFSDEDLAKRALKAVSHAITLCQNSTRKEPF
ncbi:MAG: hypothetical protein WBC19_11635 [Pyrinomonadaceae bacterium]